MTDISERDPGTTPDDRLAAGNRPYKALLRIAERHAPTPAARDRARHPDVLDPHEAVTLVTALAAGSAAAEDGEPPVGTTDLADALALMPLVRGRVDDMEASLITIARGHAMTWGEIATALGLRSAQAAQQRSERLARRTADPELP